jgi:hypothetical protein
MAQVPTIMLLSRSDTNRLHLELSEQEMQLLWACLRESFATFPRGAYALRTGVELATASKMADDLLAQMRREGLPE